MNNDLISREALKKACAKVVKSSNNSDFIPCPTWNDAMDLIDNAPTVEMPNDILKAYYLGYSQAKVDLERPQGEWVRKEDVIHSIAKQYSEHNELVPIWLSIGDMKGGAE